jgi:hypothetical protein
VGSPLDFPDYQVKIVRTCRFGGAISFMPSPQPENNTAQPTSRPMNHKCRHPRVQIVARAEDSEFVECLECREVFESSEFKDMAIEDSALDEA